MSHDYMENAHAVMAEALTADEIPPVESLMGRLMAANFRDYSNTTSMLIEGYQRTIADLEAELGAIRSGINDLFAGPYMPNQDAIIQAVFYPHTRREAGVR